MSGKVPAHIDLTAGIYSVGKVTTGGKERKKTSFTLLLPAMASYSSMCIPSIALYFLFSSPSSSERGCNITVFKEDAALCCYKSTAGPCPLFKSNTKQEKALSFAARQAFARFKSSYEKCEEIAYWGKYR